MGIAPLALRLVAMPLDQLSRYLNGNGDGLDDACQVVLDEPQEIQGVLNLTRFVLKG